MGRKSVVTELLSWCCTGRLGPAEGSGNGCKVVCHHLAGGLLLLNEGINGWTGKWVCSWVDG